MAEKFGTVSAREFREGVCRRTPAECLLENSCRIPGGSCEDSKAPWTISQFSHKTIKKETQNSQKVVTVCSYYLFYEKQKSTGKAEKFLPGVQKPEAPAKQRFREPS